MNKHIKVATLLILTILMTGLGYAEAEFKEMPLQQAGVKTTKPDVKEIILNQGEAQTLQIDDGVTEVFVASPDIADVQLNSPKVLYVYAKKPGSTMLFVTNEKGHSIMTHKIKVSHNIVAFREVAAKTANISRVEAISLPDGIALKGLVDTPQAAHDIEVAAASFIGANEKVINNLSVASPTQVYLKVKIAEVNRSVLNGLDINWGAIVSPSHFAFGLLTGGRLPTAVTGALTASNQPSNATYTPALQFNDGVTNLATLIDVLNQENLASLLAEPNLIALSGQTASFLVGQEIPYPVPQEQNVTIEFKKIGISLSFTPLVLGSNRINLRVSPEVSELDTTVKLVLATSGSTPVYGIKTRRADTSVELASGQSLAIAGLFTRSSSNAVDSIPGLGNIPVLGALFKSTAFQRNETELVIVVTPYIVEPTTEAALALPTDNLYHASNFEMLMFNKINRDDVSQAEMAGQLRLNGVSGFYLD